MNSLHDFRHTQPSPELIHKRDAVTRQEGSINGKRTIPVNASQQATFSAPSPPSTDYDNFDDDQKSDPLDRRYSYSSSFFHVPHLLFIHPNC